MMTNSGETGPTERPGQGLAEATGDLAKVRALLESAARGEAGTEDLKNAVQGYLDQHTPALQAAAAALGEETRLKTLQELYKWRDQLNAQLKARHGTS
jgi:hypothetical protein